MDQIPIGSLYNRTLELLRTSQFTLPEIFRRSGISFYWLKRFKEGRIVDPSVNKVQALYEFLSGRKLEV